ncbi:MAG TPA: hypothetical protein VLT91_12405 [Rhizomicrobium sp.]|nr:hypothetical protein [Rhizomicrobium sp.]
MTKKTHARSASPSDKMGNTRRSGFGDIKRDGAKKARPNDEKKRAAPARAKARRA